MELLRFAASALRRIPGSLVVLPMAVAAIGTNYSCVTSETIATGLVTGASSTELVSLRFEIEGADPPEATRLDSGEHLLVRLPAPMTPRFLEIQADCCTEYSVSGITPAGESIELGSVSEAEGVAGLHSRTIGLGTDTPVTALRIAPVQGDGDYAVSAIRVSADEALSHATLVYIAWGLFLVLVVVKRFAPRTVGDLVDVWARADAPLAVVVILTLVFRPTSMLDAVAPMTVAVTATAAIAALVVVACRQAFQRLSYPALLYNAVIIVLAVWLVPQILATVVEQSVFHDYEPTIDHRMRPDGNEVNVDSIRFRGVSESIDAEDFNIVFLGDSFTYGYRLEYEDSVPYVMEKHLASHTCDSPVRVINFGWSSSSPLLSLRLLRDIGHKYHPDLVVYMLDMTDFHDDLDYGQRFTSLQRSLILPSAVAFRLLERAALAVFDRSEIERILANVRTSLKREPDSDPGAPILRYESASRELRPTYRARSDEESRVDLRLRY